MSPEEALDVLREAVVERDYDRVTEVCRSLAADIRLEAVDLELPTGLRLLKLLRAYRRFNDLIILGAAVSRAFPENHTLRRLYAQGMIDSGHLDQALEVLAGVVANPEVPRKEQLEAWGLTGRVHKQFYVDSPAPAERKGKWLQLALDAYTHGWSDEAKEGYHGVNLVALLARAREDGVELDTDLDLDEIATALVHEVDLKDVDGEAQLWDYVIAMEAALALGETRKAIEWAERYVQMGVARKRGEFEFASTLRQLNEVWRIDPESEFGKAVLPMLEAVVLDRSLHTESGTGAVELDAGAVARMRSDETFDRLQRVFGDQSFVTTRWLHSLLDRLAGIGSVAEINGGGIGTGFVVQGSTLSDRLGEDWYFVTNSHVVSDDEELIRRAPPSRKPRRPEDVEITFETFFKGEDDKFKVKEVVFTSPPEELDVTVLRLDRPVYEGQIEPYPSSVHLKEPSERPRLYIAGHPGGMGLRISMHDNHLIDFNDERMHYRTPTNPGSSGSPVFNDQWKLVGLHHAGSSEMPRLDGSGELIEANEGIRLGAILEGLRAHLEGGDDG